MSMPGDAYRVHRLGGAGVRAHGVWTAPGSRPDVLALRALSGLYGAVTAARRSAYRTGLLPQTRVGAPVISIGNLAVGGSGKTPFSSWLVSQLRTRGQTPALLHGGYASDEPALHRQWTPDIAVFAGKDRVASARSAIAGGATVIVLDDGLQHSRLYRDLDLVLISADTWDQPHRLLPAGPWREPLEALPSEAFVVVTRKAVTHEAAERVAGTISTRVPNRGVCICALELADLESRHSGIPPDRAVALAAVADPFAFAAQLLQRGVAIEDLLVFGDHHDYTPADIADIKRITAGRALITTEKDAVKLSLVAPELPYWVATQRLVIERGEQDLQAAIAGAVGPAPAS